MLRNFVAFLALLACAGAVVYFFFLWERFLNYIFWRKDPTSVILRLFLRKDKRTLKIFYEIWESVVDKDFKFRCPWITTTKQWVRPLPFWGRAYLSKNMIVITGYLINQLNDSELSAVIAHELGHLIDYQTKRKGHPFFTPEKAALLGNEMMAWEIADYITSPEIVDNYFTKRNSL